MLILPISIVNHVLLWLCSNSTYETLHLQAHMVKYTCTLTIYWPHKVRGKGCTCLGGVITSVAIVKFSCQPLSRVKPNNCDINTDYRYKNTINVT